MATDFHILCGFLGSGKTTLLLDLLGTPEGADTAVLVNDVGAINVDGAVVASSGDTQVAMLSNGCVCCSVGNDLVATVDDLVYGRIDAGLPPFRRMVLECSGLSRPSPIVRSLADLGAHDFRVRVLSTFDAGQGTEHAASFEEAAAQLAAAQAIVLTRLDLDGAPDAAASAAAARAVNPLARIVAEPDRPARALAAFDGQGLTAAAVADPAAAVGGLRAMRHPRIGVFLATLPAGCDWGTVAHWIEDLAARCGDRLLRVKGAVAVAGVDGPLLIQGVGTIFGPPMRLRPGTGGEPGRLVIIARDLSRAELAEVCEPYGATVVET
ncbi:GTP-binding protein [Thalassobaculum fulvum]|uniref:GTP-binding protein n=1 Tax=Thalassobaculum fulvum TaxID=1633335 RepID=A0A918XP32_9PROT|nr:GTP-binding protein [Thalassobaculum fulvum]GHD41105.1 GTP-binding protein [Thalassobaculum fulvum]